MKCWKDSEIVFELLKLVKHNVFDLSFNLGISFVPDIVVKRRGNLR